MKIVLTQTGGLLGRTKAASAEWPDSAEAFDTLLDQLKLKRRKPTKDHYAYFIKSDTSAADVPVSISDIPEQYTHVFDELYQNLKVVPD